MKFLWNGMLIADERDTQEIWIINIQILLITVFIISQRKSNGVYRVKKNKIIEKM